MKLFKNNFHHTKRVEKVSFKLDIPEGIVEETLDIMYDYIRTKIDSVDIDEDVIMSEELFDEKFPVISVPSLGYIRPSYKKYKHIMKNKIKKQHAKSKQQQSK